MINFCKNPSPPPRYLASLESEYQAIKALTRAAKEKARNQAKTNNNKKKAEEYKQAAVDHQNASLLNILNKTPVPMKRAQAKAKATGPVPQNPAVPPLSTSPSFAITPGAASSSSVVPSSVGNTSMAVRNGTMSNVSQTQNLSQRQVEMEMSTALKKRKTNV